MHQHYTRRRQAPRPTSMSECSSSHVDEARSTGKLDCGVIVETICSSASAPRPGIAYRCAIWYIDSADAGCGGGVGCMCGSTLDIDDRARCLCALCG